MWGKDTIRRLDFTFTLADESVRANLLANPNEQIFVEKLLSLLRHRTLSRRPKDVFDIYYLCDHVDVMKLRSCLDSLIYTNRRIMPRNAAEVVAVLKDVFASRQFMRRLANTSVNWIQVDPIEATQRIIGFLESLKV